MVSKLGSYENFLPDADRRGGQVYAFDGDVFEGSATDVNEGNGGPKGFVFQTLPQACERTAAPFPVRFPEVRDKNNLPFGVLSVMGRL